MTNTDTAELLKFPTHKLPDFHRGYIEAAFWLADPAPGSGEYYLDPDDYDSLSDDAKAALLQACNTFIVVNRSLLDRACEVEENYTDHQAGIDFYLSAHGHGSGYFARGNQTVWDELQEAARCSHAPELHLACTNAGDCNGPGNCDACDSHNGEYEVFP
jgi:hypothetical protein